MYNISGGYQLNPNLINPMDTENGLVNRADYRGEGLENSPRTTVSVDKPVRHPITGALIRSVKLHVERDRQNSRFLAVSSDLDRAHRFVPGSTELTNVLTGVTPVYDGNGAAIPFATLSGGPTQAADVIEDDAFDVKPAA